MTLDKLAIGQNAVLGDIDPSHFMRHRMMEMGLTPGTSVSVLRVAPLGDPMEIKLRGFRLSIRKSDAAYISCRTL
jgi:ferrous iron transport protein B